ncbi:AAA family ATPase [Mycolicibacterium helvum]|uniref:Uncharacterized protein n=1 Tax=Mycolicibacterium helvum TaxID=1534349 RepID=A0A7I7THB4_9MYCO|nr:AAA family ATPase [Mycolicibacterium helvum]BBY67769.1 hypothetical protein MHEL_60120 [Mycolicibacterium helvum]
MPIDRADFTTTAAPSATNGRGPGAPSDGPDARAEWVSGMQWADALNVDPETPIADVLGAETWNAVRKFCRQYDVTMYLPDGASSMAFLDFDALPTAVVHTARPKVIFTRAQVIEFAADTITDDPHLIGERLKRARWDRFDRKKRTDDALNARKIPASTAYTLGEIDAVAGPEVAGKCRQQIDDANRKAWSHPKPHSFREHEYVMTAAELVGPIGVPVEVIAAMTKATAAERNAALAELSIARIRYNDGITARARAGGVPALDLDAEVLTLSGLAKLEAVRPLIEGFLPRGQLADLNGQPGAGKTMAAVSMAAAIASGRTWCGHAVPERAPVLYVAAEGASGIRARLLAWCEANRVAPESIEDTFIIAPRAVQMGDEGHMAQVLDVVKRHGVALVVFDTRARCTVGVEENSATDHGRVIANADDINQQTGAAVLVVHHTAAGGERARGTTAWDGAVWSSLLLTRSGGKKAKKSRKVEINCVKHKEWSDGCTHEFRLTDHTVGEPLMPEATALQRSTLVLAGIDPYTDEPDEEQSLSVTQAEILALVAEHGGGDGLTRSEIVKFATEQGLGSRSAIYKAVAALHDDGKQLVRVAGTQRLAVRALTENATNAGDGVTVVGSPTYTEAVETILTALCLRKAEGRITDDTAKTDAHRLVGGHVVPFAEAWGRWSVNRPTDPGEVEKLASGATR